MYQVLLVSTGNVVASSLSTLRDAEAEAITIAKEELKKDAYGRRLLAWCKNQVTWQVAKQYVIVQEMFGMWIETNGGRCLPEDIDDGDMLLFTPCGYDGEIVQGYYRDGEFISAGSGRPWEPDEIAAFFVVPVYNKK